MKQLVTPTVTASDSCVIIGILTLDQVLQMELLPSHRWVMWDEDDFKSLVQRTTDQRGPIDTQALSDLLPALDTDQDFWYSKTICVVCPRSLAIPKRLRLALRHFIEGRGPDLRLLFY